MERPDAQRRSHDRSRGEDDALRAARRELRDAGGEDPDQIDERIAAGREAALHRRKPCARDVHVDAVEESDRRLPRHLHRGLRPARRERDAHARDPGRAYRTSRRRDRSRRPASIRSATPSATRSTETYRWAFVRHRTVARTGPSSSASRDRPDHLPHAGAVPQRDPRAGRGQVPQRQDVGADPGSPSCRTTRPAGCRAGLSRASRRSTRGW